MTRDEWIRIRTERRDALYDALDANSAGLTIDDIEEELDCTTDQAKVAVRDLRLFLEDTDISVPCTPQGQSERWLYTLQAGDGDDVRGWAKQRIDDGETRLRTIHAVTASAVNATDGRTSEGKRARLMERTLRHLIEDLDSLRDA